MQQTSIEIFWLYSLILPYMKDPQYPMVKGNSYTLTIQYLLQRSQTSGAQFIF